MKAVALSVAAFLFVACAGETPPEEDPNAQVPTATTTTQIQGLVSTVGATTQPSSTATPVPAATPTDLRPAATIQRTATVALPTPTMTTVAITCDPNYTGACVPPYPPGVNCADIAAKRFQSVGSDPHGLDRDGNGIACES